MNDRFQKIFAFYRESKRMPSYSEIGELLGLKSKNAVFRLVQKMLEEGLVAKDSLGRLVPKSFGNLKMLGLVEAGFPSPAEETLDDTMSLDEWLVEKPEATYMLKVKGLSMKDAGIVEGDMVIVERGRAPRLGEIVIADVDGEYTMKYYRKDPSGRVYLEAANEDYDDIYPEGELKVVAVVKAVVRKYSK